MILSTLIAGATLMGSSEDILVGYFRGDAESKVVYAGREMVGDGKTFYPIYENAEVHASVRSKVADVFASKELGTTIDFIVYVKPNTKIKFLPSQQIGSSTHVVTELMSFGSRVEVLSDYYLPNTWEPEPPRPASEQGPVPQIPVQALPSMPLPAGRKVRASRRHAYAVGRGTHFTVECKNTSIGDSLIVRVLDTHIVDVYFRSSTGMESRAISKTDSPFTVPVETMMNKGN